MQSCSDDDDVVDVAVCDVLFVVVPITVITVAIAVIDTVTKIMVELVASV